ncbi:MAG: TIGR03087 family PEP-CTERM/XrtA system glycosyltransferase [Planctomycetota bacterium]|jgi:sugar transferase (PEP-CTERM/EpsH1 system associated)
MKILYLAHRIPYPPNKGDKIRSFHEIKFLSQRHKIDLICLADNPEDLLFKKDLEKYCNKVFVQPFRTQLAKIKGIISLLSGKSVSVGYFYHKRVQDIFNQWIVGNEYDVIICFSSTMAEYIFKSEAFQLSSLQAPRLLLVLDFCDLDSDKWLQYSYYSKFPFNLIYRMEFNRLLEYEKRINHLFDYSIFVSDSEADLFHELFPEAKNVEVISNGVDNEYFSPKTFSLEPSALSLQPPVLLFTGAMDYHANIDGVTWFHDKVLPMIKKEYPQVQFFIVGSNPASKVRNLSTNNGVKVTGFVEDIRPFYNSADISIIPLRLGRGIQNKALEAMAMEKPVVATSKAVEGIKAVTENHLLVADSPTEFAAKICSLLKDKSQRKLLGKNARKFVEKNYNWDKNLQKLEKILQANRP